MSATLGDVLTLTRTAVVFGVSLLALSCTPNRPCPVTPAPVSPTVAACAAWEREVEFARTVQNHDASGFAEHIHPVAAFMDGEAVHRGPTAIADAWKKFLRGDELRIDWGPTSVVLTGDGNLAISRGPYWIERMKPGATPRFLTGIYQSVWMLGVDGVWRVTIDGGPAPDPAPETEAEVAKIKASLSARCPMRE
jgi:ketosteroid isomerase-like protein